MLFQFLRGLFGYRNEFLTDTRGEGLWPPYLTDYAPRKGGGGPQETGALVAFETGEAVPTLYNARSAAPVYGPGTDVYAGMIVGVASKPEILPSMSARKSS